MLTFFLATFFETSAFLLAGINKFDIKRSRLIRVLQTENISLGENAYVSTKPKHEYQALMKGIKCEESAAAKSDADADAAAAAAAAEDAGPSIGLDGS